MADDVSWEAFGSYGAEDYKTPVLDKMADEGISLNNSDPIDGVRFLPTLLGKERDDREFVLCHYQPYWNKKPGQLARTAKYKLYRGGRFYQPAKVLLEKNDLSKNINSEEMMTAYKKLKAFLATCPPAPENKKEDRNAKNRPTFSNWAKLQ